jgi:hypothetical protein
MIAEQYINEGIRIRKSYIQNLKEILKQEPIIMNRKIIFEKLQNEIESTVYSDQNEIRKTMEINEKILKLEKEIKSIQEIIKPFYDSIENLKNDRDRLYLAIKEKYPNISDKQIEQEIMSKIEE